MTRIALSTIFYPVSISRYFEAALQHRPDVELVTIGPFTDSWIPWGASGMNLPEKYALPPTIPLSKNLWSVRSMNPDFLFKDDRLKDIDVWIQCDSNFYFQGRVPGEINVHIAVDPHVLDYSQQRVFADYFFNMQKFYSKPGDIYLPYCASKYHHYPMDVEKEYDVCLVGLQYAQRNELMAALRREGLKVFYTLGLGPDEYREAYNKSRVAVSWSSMQDLIARVFEAGAMDLPLVCNRVPDLPLHFDHGTDHWSFETVGEAVEYVKWYLEHPYEAGVMADLLNKKVMANHTYTHRIQQIFDTIGI